MSEVLVLDNVEIRRDSEGRYCLNDLHKAAGGEKTDQPSDFLRNAKTQDLLTELCSENSRSIKPSPVNRVLGKGKDQGTFVVKELVYAYAMWISPTFHLKVIRAFDTLQTKGVAVADHAAEAVLDDPFAFMEELFTQAKALKAQRDALKAELEVTAPKALVFDNNVANQGENLNRFVRSLKGVNTVAIKGDLARLGYLYRVGGSYRVYAKYRDVLFTEKLNIENNHKSFYDIYPTAEGKQVITKLYSEGSLTMKKGF